MPDLIAVLVTPGLLMYRTVRGITLILGWAWAGACLLTGTAQADVRGDIFDIVESVSIGENRHLLPEPLGDGQTISLFYQQRDYQPAWHDAAQIKRILATLEQSSRHGLDPQDYHHAALTGLATQWDRRVRNLARVRARFDVLLSDAVLLYARHMLEGKADPSGFEPTWNYTRLDFQPERITARLATAIDEKRVPDALQDLEPDLNFYRLLMGELERYRKLDRTHNFKTVPDDTVLKPGMSHPNVNRLRQQLQQLGHLVDGAAEQELYDQELANAVEEFQSLHSLDSDGVVGPNTFRELNISYANRADQVRVNMDRVRWVANDIAPELVIVNVAGYEMYYLRNGKLFWETDVMVGTIRHQTPFFRSKMKYLVLNPDWTVPRSIIRRSLFPKFNADPDYVVQHNYKLFDNDGGEVDPLTLDWDSYAPGRFPYRVVQQPGPGNALGRVKFIFPNQYAIYLHDTPSRALFSRTDRAFSAGCIRVRDPLHFTELLLDDTGQWPRATIDEVVKSRKMQVVHLDEPLDVMLMYWTASPRADGRIQLHTDVYSRDPPTLSALREKRTWDAY